MNTTTDTAPPTVAIAVHDGWYGTGTGAGRSNHALLGAVAAALAPGIRLVVLPVRLSPSSPEYDPAHHQRSRRLIAGTAHLVRPVDNGTTGRTRFGSLGAFRHLAADTARALAPVMTGAPRGVLVAVDLPFAGLGAHLPHDTSWRLCYLPRSTTAHHPDPDGSRRRWEAAGIAAWADRGAVFGAISAHMRDHLTRAHRIPPGRILDLPAGLTPAEAAPTRPRLPLPPRAREGFALAMGRAQPYKGFDDLLDAWALLRSAGRALPHLLLAAVTDAREPGAYQRHLAARISHDHLDATLLTRFDPRIPDWLAHPALRAVIVPSRAEPAGRIPLEAFAAGAAPVVATTAGGLAETVIDGVTGYTCAPAEPKALVRAIARALDTGPGHLAELRAAGLRLVAGRDYTTCVTGLLAQLAPWAVAPAHTGNP